MQKWKFKWGNLFKNQLRSACMAWILNFNESKYSIQMLLERWYLQASWLLGITLNIIRNLSRDIIENNYLSFYYDLTAIDFWYALRIQALTEISKQIFPWKNGNSKPKRYQSTDWLVESARTTWWLKILNTWRNWGDI